MKLFFLLATIIDKTVGKVTSFYLGFYSYPPSLVHCWKKLTILVVILCLISQHWIGDTGDIFSWRGKNLFNLTWKRTEWNADEQVCSVKLLSQLLLSKIVVTKVLNELSWMQCGRRLVSAGLLSGRSRDQHSGSLHNWVESAAFVMTSANG